LAYPAILWLFFLSRFAHYCLRFSSRHDRVPGHNRDKEVYLLSGTTSPDTYSRQAGETLAEEAGGGTNEPQSAKKRVDPIALIKSAGRNNKKRRGRGTFRKRLT